MNFILSMLVWVARPIFRLTEEGRKALRQYDELGKRTEDLRALEWLFDRGVISCADSQRHLDAIRERDTPLPATAQPSPQPFERVPASTVSPGISAQALDTPPETSASEPPG